MIYYAPFSFIITCNENSTPVAFTLHWYRPNEYPLTLSVSTVTEEPPVVWRVMLFFTMEMLDSGGYLIVAEHIRRVASSENSTGLPAEKEWSRDTASKS